MNTARISSPDISNADSDSAQANNDCESVSTKVESQAQPIPVQENPSMQEMYPYYYHYAEYFRNAMANSQNANAANPPTTGPPNNEKVYMPVYYPLLPDIQKLKSTKRAQQNRDAQRAFRLRRALYVKDLEEKRCKLEQIEQELKDIKKRNAKLWKVFKRGCDELRDLREKCRAMHNNDLQDIKIIESIADISSDLDDHVDES